MVSGICYSLRSSGDLAVRDFGITCCPSSEQPTPQLPLKHPLLPGCPFGAPSTEWNVSCASLADVVSIQTCTQTLVEKQTCIGLLFTYRDKPSQVVGQWRWDFTIRHISLADHNDGVAIYCQENTCKTLTLAVKVEAVDYSHDETWERHLLQGQIIWWYSFKAIFIIFR